MNEALATKIKTSVQQNLKDATLSSLTQDGDVQIEPISEGYLNEVCRLKSSDGCQSCIVKVYLNYVKLLGPDVPIESARCQREYEACNYFRSLLPNSTPLPYFCDPVNNIVCLEDLSGYRIWEDVLLESCDLHLGAKIADILVTLHSSSNMDNLSGEEFELLKNKFSPYPQQVAFLCDSHFVKPFLSNHRENKACDEMIRVKMDEIIQDEVVIKATELARECMSVGSGSCCIHGDLHVRSLMLSNVGEDMKMIDLECSRIGPPAFDVALLICNYVMLYHYHQELSHEDVGPGQADHSQLMADTLDIICITLSRYMEGMSRALKDKFDKHLVWRQILLLLGVEIIAWISGPANLNCLQPHPKGQLNCLNTALRILHKQSLSLDTKGLSRLIHNQH
ncbi:methylthioribose kinase [Biomphalaria glabrata]|nr:methylthioribose kinase [Biomphalaria glabrata]